MPASGPRGVALALRGFALRVGGVALVLRGRSVALCSPRDARPSQCMRTFDPYRGALPPACGLPQYRRELKAGAVTRSLKRSRHSCASLPRWHALFGRLLIGKKCPTPPSLHPPPKSPCCCEGHLGGGFFRSDGGYGPFFLAVRGETLPPRPLPAGGGARRPEREGIY